MTADVLPMDEWSYRRRPQEPDWSSLTKDEKAAYATRSSKEPEPEPEPEPADPPKRKRSSTNRVFVPAHPPKPGSRPTQQTKIARALHAGMLPGAHHEELRVLCFLADRVPPHYDKGEPVLGYMWSVGGDDWMTHQQWAEQILGMDRRRLSDALNRLIEHGLVVRLGGGGARGEVQTDYLLSEQFAEAASDWYDHVWCGSSGRVGMATAIKIGRAAGEHAASARGISRIVLPPRPKGFGKTPRKGSSAG